MSLTMQTVDDNEDDQYVLVATLDNAKLMSNILKTIHFKDVSYERF